jgi:predicted acyl esterase
VGYLNAARAESRAQPQAPEQGTPKAYSLRLWPTSYVFRAGHRIRLDLAGGAETGSGLTGPQGPGKSPYTAQITLFHDQQRSSVLELPVIGSAGEQLLRD